ncbi:MAG TPA: carotenoid oxygenase family protein [Stackebrandtia sp.]|jgi:carotenoid cleavage dioxygenase|uniref:carotenoid oxygenase family protein n=1 Tax=Stackebrandtia sp. TaxID=2023065 RepID=UPI002D69F6EE|nr:carotenoid oxygenase family protein [Stackebrandtia sp.]HZE41235.1 carotenoid oxygenase family protein [Stackebrandtia sp.]
MSTETQTPIHLAGALAPVPDEIDAVDLPVRGSLPKELNGRYLRNGPNPRPGENPGHWFAGHGMLHGVRIADGRAEWYRNRWVRTAKLAGEPRQRPDGGVNLTAHSANTHVIHHDGHLLALSEGGLPYEVDRELNTLGPCDFGGRLTTAMTAHPKRDPVTGELFFFGYSLKPPYLTGHRLSARGELVSSTPIDVPGPTMMHDFAITERFIIWMDLPITFHPELVGKGSPFQWDDAYGARLGVMPRDGKPRVTWFDVEPCYVFHVANAFDDGDDVVLDAVRYDRSGWARVWTGARDAADGNIALYRWRLDLAGGTASGRYLDDTGVEFPTINETRLGRPNRYLYSVADDFEAERAAFVKYDTVSGSSAAHRLEPGMRPGEAVFVPAADATREDDGWLLSIVTERSGRSSELLVCDASDPTAAPRAAIELPRAVPAGFHGSWIEEE